MSTFLTVDNGKIVVKNNKVVVGSAATVDQLVELLKNCSGAILLSSDVDFASEFGFAADDDAHSIIEQAVDLLSE